jgi:hypothetical protein
MNAKLDITTSLAYVENVFHFVQDVLVVQVMIVYLVFLQEFYIKTK